MTYLPPPSFAAGAAQANAEAYTDASIVALKNAAPPALDTLGELAAALGDDPAFSNHVARTNFAVVYPQGLPGHGARFEIQKDAAPLDYGTTHAAFVVQQRDPEALGANQLVPGAVFQFASTGDGNVVAPAHFSSSIWMGLLATMEKTGDGSGQAVTVIGELNAVGAVGYNELGGFQGTITNLASVNGTISGLEFVLKDSPDAGVTSFDTQMHSVNARIAKYSVARTRTTVAFFASSEGTQSPDAIMAVNGTPAAPNAWRAGLDLSGASFDTGVAMFVPNNASLDWLDNAHAAQPIFGVNAANVTWLRPASAAAHIELEKYDGTAAFSVDGASGKFTAAATAAAIINNTAGGNILNFQNNGVTNTQVRGDGTLNFPAAVTTLAVGAAGGAAAPPATPAGYLFFAVAGATFRIPYYN